MPICGFRQGALTGRLARPIDVENEEVVPLLVLQSARLLLFHKRSRQEIVQKKGPQGLDRGLVKGSEKAAEYRTCWQAIASEERHEAPAQGWSLS